MKNAVLALLMSGVVLVACVGNDPTATSDNPPVAATQDAAAVLPPNTVDAGTSSDAASAHTDGGDEAGGSSSGGGVTLAQLSIEAAATASSIVAAPNGGALLAFVKSGGPDIAVGGMTVTGCSSCTILTKLRPDLTAEWWMTYESGVQLAQSPNGNTYWLLQSGGGATTTRQATLTRSNGAPVSFNIPGCCGNQGDEAGGASIVVALDAAGGIRWTHVLAETNVVVNADGGPEIATTAKAFAASDDRVVFASYATGTLEYTDITGNRVSKVLIANVSSYVVQVMDAATGRTRDLFATPVTLAHEEHAGLVGTAAFTSDGFIGVSEEFPASSNNTPSSRLVASFSAQGSGAFTASNLLTTSASAIQLGTYQQIFALGSAYTDKSFTFGAKTFTTPANHATDAMFFLFDNTSPNVKASLTLGGSGAERSGPITDARNGDVYLTGFYRSSDITVANTLFPPASDPTTDGIFAVRASIDAPTNTMVPVWAHPFAGSARIAIESITSDAVSGDLYMSGWLSKGKASFGLGDITTPGTGLDETRFVTRLRR